MNKYLETIRIYLKLQLVWRSDAVIHLLLSVTRIMFAVLLWGIIYSEHQTVAGFSYDGMLSYYIISSFLVQLEQSRDVSEEMASRIRKGTFSNLVVLPVSAEGYYMARTCGKMLFYLGSDLGAAVLWTCVFRIRLVLAGSIWPVAGALVLIALGMIFMVQLNYFLGILTFKYEEIGTFLMIKDNLMGLMTGSIVPLALFPEIFVKGMRLLPFYYITYLPSMLLTGRCREEAAAGIGMLLLWCIVIQVLIVRTWKKYRIKYDGAGI